MECSDWAHKFFNKTINQNGTAIFYVFKPNYALVPGAKYLGRFTDNHGNRFLPQPPWKWHIAAEAKGIMYDEIHSKGVMLSSYLNFFEDIDYISFEKFSEITDAVTWAHLKI